MIPLRCSPRGLLAASIALISIVSLVGCSTTKNEGAADPDRIKVEQFTVHVNKGGEPTVSDKSTRTISLRELDRRHQATRDNVYAFKVKADGTLVDGAGVVIPIADLTAYLQRTKPNKEWLYWLTLEDNAASQVSNEATKKLDEYGARRVAVMAPSLEAFLGTSEATQKPTGNIDSRK